MFVIPSRWFAGGKGLDEFRDRMLNRKDIRMIQHFDDASSIFGSQVEIKGGVSYFLKDANYHGLTMVNGKKQDIRQYDVLVVGIDRNDIIIRKLSRSKRLTDIYLPTSYYGIETNDKRLQAHDEKGFIECHVSIQKGSIMYIDSQYIPDDKRSWKVITPTAAHEHGSGFGNIIISKSSQVFSRSYIGFRVQNRDEAKSLASYMNCKLPNFMLSLRKVSQDINAQTCKWIPLPPLDRVWTDETVYRFYKITKEEQRKIDLWKNKP
jgi:site-specific DNA-methyltransferase (adenine-specific)